MKPSFVFAFCLLAGGCGSRTLDAGPVDASIDAQDSALDGASDAVDFTACSAPGSCVVLPASCCGTCGAATTSDMIGVALARAGDYRGSVCDGVGCPACYMEQDPFLQAFCVDGRCAARDLHVDELTACAKDADCKLRYSPCCESCGAPTTNLLALSIAHVADYVALVCAPDTSACPKCAVGYPPGAKAVCDATGHCAVSGLH